MPKTERITIRLPEAMAAQMDALVSLGKYGTRTEVIRHALRDFFELQGSKAKDMIQSDKQMRELLEIAAKVENLRQYSDSL